jgi:RNA exonuclease 1
MHSVLSNFFSGPVSGEEKKKRIAMRLACAFYFPSVALKVTDLLFVAERSVVARNPAQYMLTLEEMIENEYPIPSYMADIFEKPAGWVETPQPTTEHESLLLPSTNKQQQKVYAVDCEMVGGSLVLWIALD